ncbi:MAG: FmdE family protein [Caldimicrobium sp.]|nr:FmdE family protein [Caldimicrobium sp.]MCX7613174.1 FmdE family protein [Caldimicrobium sp.]MDW8182524.1 FmdE family protein [Caldimicrobium sp.]
MHRFNPFEISFETLLEICKERHGHLCAGQVIGARLSLLGLQLIGIKDPHGEDRKKFLVFVEIDRCATDAIQTVTGATLGKRTMKYLDYGIMAATFLNLETNKAFRIMAKESAKEKAKEYFPEIETPALRELLAYKIMPVDDLFEVEEVIVRLNDCDLPGKPKKKVICAKCQVVIRDGKEVYVEDKPYCKLCAGLSYFERKSAHG